MAWSLRKRIRSLFFKALFNTKVSIISLGDLILKFNSFVPFHRLLSVILIAYFGLNLELYHLSFLNWKVSPKIVKITLPGNHNAGGTGFFIKNSRGETKLLTNAHICRDLPNGMGMADIDGNGEPQAIFVEEISEKTDLCLLSGAYGVEGLAMGSQVERGQRIAVLGHPKLDPITVVKGIVVSNSVTRLIIEEKSIKNIGECNGRGEQIEKEIIFLAEVPVCVVSINSYILTSQIYPGNSGSPVVDFWGRVVGIIFASDTMTWKGRMIGVEEIADFIQ